MNAHVLRKWSLAKNLMFLLLPVLITLVFWCQFTTALAPSSVLSLSHNDITNHSFHHKYRRHARHLINQYANIDNHNISNDNNQIIINQINSNDDHVNTNIKTQTISNMLKSLYNKNAKSTDNTNFNKLIERSKANNQNNNVPSVPNLNKISQKFTHNIYADDDANGEEEDDDDDNDNNTNRNKIENVIIAVRPKISNANQTLNGDISSIEVANEQPLTDVDHITNENASQNRILLQYRMKRARNELYRRFVHRQQLNAFNNNSSQQQTHQIGRSRRVSRSNMNRYSNVSFKFH